MSSLSFTKLFSSITDSSIWQESSETRIVWVTMLAMADKNGCVTCSVPGLAHRSNVSREATRAALLVFLSPDPDSSSKAFEGRRIEEVAGGWKLLNYQAYREKRDVEDRNASKSGNQAISRDKHNLGYIYFAQNGHHVKIGYSKNPWSRVNELRCACPTLTLVGLERGSIQDEKAMHEKFSYLHHDREWFTLDATLADYINSLPRLEKVTHWMEDKKQIVAQSVVNYEATTKQSIGSVVTTKDYAELRRHNAEAEAEAEAKTTTNTLASSSSELPAAPRKLVCTLPLNQGDHQVFEDDVQQWQALYPAIDVRQELRNTKGWLIGNPKLRKTKTGINRFINSWLSRAQNEAKPTGGGNGRNQTKTSGNLDAARGAFAILAEAERNSCIADEMQPQEGLGDESGDLSHLRTGSIEL